jgi:hypothetical protein
MGWVVSVTPRPPFSPGKRTPSTNGTGGWVGPRSCRLCQGSNVDRQIVQPVARHCTEAPYAPHALTLSKLCAFAHSLFIIIFRTNIGINSGLFSLTSLIFVMEARSVSFDVKTELFKFIYTNVGLQRTARWTYYHVLLNYVVSALPLTHLTLYWKGFVTKCTIYIIFTVVTFLWSWFLVPLFRGFNISTILAARGGVWASLRARCLVDHRHATKL